MAERLWEKGEGVNAEVHRFTVGSDPVTDRELVRFDILGSAAHARMLAAVGLLAPQDLSDLLESLGRILRADAEGRFVIAPELEDCHTAIEAALTADIGEAGKRIHTGRSRNDQVLLAVRLYLRSEAVGLCVLLEDFVKKLGQRYDKAHAVPMPGYTHLQPAMPSSVGMWLDAYAEGAVELLRDGLAFLQAIDANPLGAGAGFGVPLPLDRRLTAQLLGFSRVQRNPIDVQNSRGRYELRMLRWLSDIAGLVEKFSWDLLLFSTREFGFFALPAELTTGSSIMPQKHNPDVLELLRASASKIRGAEAELTGLTAKLPSSYHRDFQLTKEPLLRAVTHTTAMLQTASVVVDAFLINDSRLREAMTPELYATADAYRAVKNGVPFRDAYRESASKVREGRLNVSSLNAEMREFEEGLRRSHRELQSDFEQLVTERESWKSRFERVEAELFGRSS